MMLDCIAIDKVVPDSFWQIPARVYAAEAVRLAEDPAVLSQVIAEEAARQPVLLYTDHQNLRLLGIFPPAGPDAYFGLWETQPEAALNEAAFAALAAEARRRGYQRLVGPLCFSTFHRYRLRLGAPPSWGSFTGEPVNPAYYPALLARLGFAPTLTFESRLLAAGVVPTVYHSKAALLEQLQNVPFEFVPLTPATWAAHETDIYDLIQAIYGANPAYRPISRGQFRLLYNEGYAAQLCPHTSVLLREQASGRLVAQSFCHPNYAPLALPAGQPPVFARDYPRLPRRTLLAKSVGVHPHYRQQGLMSFLGAYGMVTFREFYDEIIFCLMRTDNFSRHFTDGFPYETASYALYARPLAGPAPASTQ